MSIRDTYDPGTITFRQHHPADMFSSESTIEHTITADASLDDVLQAFEHFLLGCGYQLQQGQHIGYEYEESVEGSQE